MRIGETVEGWCRLDGKLDWREGTLDAIFVRGYVIVVKDGRRPFCTQIRQPGGKKRECQN